MEPLAWPLQGRAAEDIYLTAQSRNNADHYPLLAGQALRLLKRGPSATEIVAELAAEAEACMQRFCGST
ncbi:MAG: hypothetical protein C4293_08475 [Nitrospiraceae bacterium]